MKKRQETGLHCGFEADGAKTSRSRKRNRWSLNVRCHCPPAGSRHPSRDNELTTALTTWRAAEMFSNFVVCRKPMPVARRNPPCSHVPTKRSHCGERNRSGSGGSGSRIPGRRQTDQRRSSRRGEGSRHQRPCAALSTVCRWRPFGWDKVRRARGSQRSRTP